MGRVDRARRAGLRPLRPRKRDSLNRITPTGSRVSSRNKTARNAETARDIAEPVIIRGNENYRESSLDAIRYLLTSPIADRELSQPCL